MVASINNCAPHLPAIYYETANINVHYGFIRRVQLQNNLCASFEI